MTRPAEIQLDLFSDRDGSPEGRDPYQVPVHDSPGRKASPEDRALYHFFGPNWKQAKKQLQQIRKKESQKCHNNSQWPQQSER